MFKGLKGNMKILHMLVAPAAGGAEVYVKDLVKALAHDGLEMHVGFLAHAEEINRSKEFEESFLNDLRNAGVSYFFIGNEARRKLWLGVHRVSDYCKKNGIDIYHSHLPYATAFGLFLKIPRFYTHHSVEPRLGKFMYMGFNKIIDHYIGISEICAEALRTYTNRSVSTIMNGVDPGKLLQRQRESVVDRKVQALAIGRIVPEKDYYFLVDSVKIIPKEVRQRLHIRIAGEGEPLYTQALQAYVSENGLENNFEFLGNRSDIPELIDRSDIFLMSSAYEGLPIALIEATVSGLPCLVTDVGGCREIINSCYNGVAIPHGQIEAYALALTDLISDPDVYRRCALNAIVNSEELGISQSAKSHSELYISVLSEKA